MRRSTSALCGLAARTREKIVSMVLNDPDLERCSTKEAIDILRRLSMLLTS